MIETLHRSDPAAWLRGLGRWARSHLRVIPRSVLAITALFVVLGVWWSIITPIGRPPDEPAHFDLVAAVASSGRYPDYDGRVISQGAGLMKGVFPLLPEFAPERGARATLTDSGGNDPLLWPDSDTGKVSPVPNQMPQHPPLYYVVAAVGLRAARALAGGEFALDREVLMLRLVGVAIVAPVPIWAFEAARRLGASGVAARGASAMTLGVPQLLHVSAAVSYTPLLVGIGAVLAVVLAGVMRGDERTATAVRAGALVAGALWTTSSAVFLIPWVGLVYLYRGWSNCSWRQAIRGASMSLGVALAAGSPWWIRNWLVHGNPVPSTDSDQYATIGRPDGFSPHPWEIVDLAIRYLPSRFFGSFGTMFSAPMRPALVTALTILSALGLVAALVPRRLGSDDGLATSRLAVFLAPLPLLLGFILYRSWDLYQMSGFVTFLQGRYAFVAFVPFAVVVSAGLARLARRWTPLLLILVALIAQAEGSRAALDNWWAEPTASFARNLSAVSRWNPVSDTFPYVVLVVIAAVAMWLTVNLVRSTLGSGASPHEATSA